MVCSTLRVRNLTVAAVTALTADPRYFLMCEPFAGLLREAR
jgi:hypothetical protein